MDINTEILIKDLKDEIKELKKENKRLINNINNRQTKTKYINRPENKADNKECKQYPKQNDIDKNYFIINFVIMVITLSLISFLIYEATKIILQDCKVLDYYAY